MSDSVDIQIAPMAAEDAPAIGRFYVETFPQAIFAKLGVGFAARFHRWLQNEPDTEVWVAKDRAGVIHGVIAGTLNRPSAYGHAVRSHLARVILSVLASLYRPGVILWILRTLWTRVRRHRGEERTAAQPPAEMLVIAVHEAAKGSGLAWQLVEHMECAFRAWGFTGTYKILTLSTNARANAFYQRLGAHLAAKVPAQTFLVHEYHKEITADAG